MRKLIQKVTTSTATFQKVFLKNETPLQVDDLYQNQPREQ